MSRDSRKGYLLITLFFTGAAVMVIELMGTRVVAPTYGAGLFVWASLITVALTCLSIGYWLGGVVADRRPVLGTVYLLVLISGLTLLPVPFLAPVVLRMGSYFGFRFGPLFSAYVLFSVPLVLLGMVSPCAVRIAAMELKILGRTAGKLYAVSTLGSFAGTILTGFVLIPSIGTRMILYVQGTILIMLWLIYLLLNRKYAVIPLLLFFPGLTLFPGKIFSSRGNDPAIVFATESFYGQIKVWEWKNSRMILYDGVNQSAIETKTYLPGNVYIYSFEMMMLFRPEAKDALVIGLAGGNIPRRLWDYGIKSDVVDIEPKMEAIAKKYFGFLDDFGNVYIRDGRNFIKNTGKKYDFVIVDAYSGESAAFHLLTLESFGEIRKILKPGGILAINLLDILNGEPPETWKSVCKTLKGTFGSVRVFSLSRGIRIKNSIANIVFFASDAPMKLKQDVTAVHGRLARHIVGLYLGSELEADESGIVLTDDYCPLEYLRRDVSQSLRQPG